MVFNPDPSQLSLYFLFETSLFRIDHKFLQKSCIIQKIVTNFRPNLRWNKFLSLLQESILYNYSIESHSIGFQETNKSYQLKMGFCQHNYRKLQATGVNFQTSVHLSILLSICPPVCPTITPKTLRASNQHSQA